MTMSSISPPVKVVAPLQHLLLSFRKLLMPLQLTLDGVQESITTGQEEFPLILLQKTRQVSPTKMDGTPTHLLLNVMPV